MGAVCVCVGELPEYPALGQLQIKNAVQTVFWTNDQDCP